MTTKTTHRTERDVLGVYLNDHLAGATVGLELVRRMAASAESGSESDTDRKRLVSEIAADRSALIKIMTTLGNQDPRLQDVRRVGRREGRAP